MMNQVEIPFDFEKPSISERLAFDPKGYSGLYAFHKYWGKKPSETIGFLIERLSLPNDVVCDPFVGSGVVVAEALNRSRRAIGIDINPVAIEIAKFLTNPPAVESVKRTFLALNSELQSKINESYAISHSSGVGTHYLWREQRIESVWTKNGRNRSRLELLPRAEDLDLAHSFANYEPRLLRRPVFFDNSRINTKSSLTARDLFTGRALRNIELILEAVLRLPSPLKETFLLCLSASSGQMSRMVFAITNRGKTTGRISQRTEVGSWVIGYWRPKLNFEVNVWNCYEGKVKRLINTLTALDQSHSYMISEESTQVLQGTADAAIKVGNALSELKELPPNSISLILTDPPHSDRIPYLELSEIWNMILGAQSNFEEEIVVSNASKRGKSKAEYNSNMREFLNLADRVLTPGGILALIFNARDSESWQYFDQMASGGKTSLCYAGYFPLNYSASSVVQDNRKGSLEKDFVLVFTKGRRSLKPFESTAGWSADYPNVILRNQ